MKPFLFGALALLASATLPVLAQNQHPALPLLRVPQGAGINIHFTDPQPGEMKMLADGYRFVRMDFSWGGTEKEKGVYDFSAYDRLLKSCDEHKVRALFILDYGNNLYDDGLSPHTDEGRAAMGKWAAAAVTHFKGRGVLWEMFNEPNIGFWKPKPNVNDYILMDKAVAAAIRQAAPGECYFGAATSTIDMKFLEACFQSGALERWDAVSVHPYRQNDPETVAGEYRNLRMLIERYKPKNKVVPIISGEWGYSTAWDKFNYERQGKYLPRQWMTNLMNDVPISIFYDWHDDGVDPKESEHHFGTVENQTFAGRDPIYNPKPSYTAAKTLTHFFDGYDFNKRLALVSPDDYLLLFTKGASLKLAVWTTKEAHEITVPASAGRFRVTDYLGATQPEMTAVTGGLKLQISDGPLYLEPTVSNTILRSAATWARVPLDMFVKAPNRVKTGGFSLITDRTGNQIPIAQIKEVLVTRNSSNQMVRRFKWVEGVTLRQTSEAVVTNPLRLTLSPAGQNLVVKVENPSGEALSGRIVGNYNEPQNIVFNTGETEKTVSLRGAQATGFSGGWETKVRFEGTDPLDVVEEKRGFSPIWQMHVLNEVSLPKDYKITPDGDAKIESEQTLSVEQPAEGPSPADGPSLRLTYRFAPGWKFANLQPMNKSIQKMAAQAKALGMWIYGDNSGNVLRMRYRDAGGQTFQPNGTSVNWQGWKYFEFPLDGSGGHWGGAADGKLHYPLQLESLLIFDSIKSENNRGAIYLSAPMWIY